MKYKVSKKKVRRAQYEMGFDVGCLKQWFVFNESIKYIFYVMSERTYATTTTILS